MLASFILAGFLWCDLKHSYQISARMPLTRANFIVIHFNAKLYSLVILWTNTFLEKSAVCSFKCSDL